MGEGPDGLSPIALYEGIMTSKLKEAIGKVRKALVAAVTIVVLRVLHNYGIEIDNDTVMVILDSILVSGAVWAVPNSRKVFDEQV